MHQEQTSVLIGGILEEKWRGEWVYFIQADVGWKAWWVVQVNNICLDAMYTGEIKFNNFVNQNWIEAKFDDC